MTERSRPSDAFLKEALSRRAAGPHTSVELLIDVRAAVETIPQGIGWRWRFGPRPQWLPVVVLTLLLLAAVVGYALALGGAVIVPASDSGEIAFVRATYGWSDAYGLTVADRRILTVDADGGEPTLLAEVPGLEVPGLEGRLALRHGASGPALQVSPDGQRIAFRVFNRSAGLYVMNRDGTELARLAELPWDDSTDGLALNGIHQPIDAGLAWSPDGRRIAFNYPFYSRSSSVYVVDVDTGVRRQITAEAAFPHARMVAWSSDGSQLAFARQNDDAFLAEGGQIGPSSSLIVMNADGTGAGEVDQAEGWRIGRIAWSPDSAVIAWVRYEVGGIAEELVVTNADGTGTRRLAGGSGPCCPFDTAREPVAWSPDGTRIAFSRGGEIWIAWVDGSGSWKLTYGVSPSWSPDGSQLVFARSGNPIPGAPPRVPLQHSVYVINADGTGLRWLADGEYPAWAPASGGGD